MFWFVDANSKGRYFRKLTFSKIAGNIINKIRAINKLEKLNIIVEVTSKKRDQVYCAKEILDILEEPAQIR